MNEKEEKNALWWFLVPRDDKIYDDNTWACLVLKIFHKDACVFYALETTEKWAVKLTGITKQFMKRKTTTKSSQPIAFLSVKPRGVCIETA